MRKTLGNGFLILITMVLVLGACGPDRGPSDTPMVPPEGTLEIPAPTPTAEAQVTGGAVDLPPAVEYNLGEATIVQERFPEDSRFRNMPVRLNGLIAAPEEGGPYPVVVIFHGTHPGCPEDEMGVDRWPCDPEVEQPNYRGFEYLVRALAARGYVALSLNINAENTFGFGEPVDGERLQQLVDLHLEALATAATGGPNDFGLDLEGRADPGRLALFGHSRGGDAAYWLAHTPEMAAGAGAGRGYGPVYGLLLIAPAAASFYAPAESRMPMAILLPACDADVKEQVGQVFFEGARQAPVQTQWVTSVWLERANHNYFNQLLPDDPFGRRGRPDCEPLLDPEVQRDFLVDYAADFLATLFAEDAMAVSEAKARLGMDVQSPAPGELYGLPAHVANLAGADDRQRLLVPATADELVTNLQGGRVTEQGITTHFCPEGYYTPFVMPGSEPCRRANVVIPGNPALVVVSWTEPGGTWRFALPEGNGDLSGYTTFSLRAAVDPLSPLNTASGPQAFTLQLTDRAGNSAAVQTRPDEPALAFPPGLVEDDPTFGGLFTGRVPMTTIRLPLSDFEGVDLANISEIALVFDRTPSGSLFLGDVEWVRPSQP